MPLSNLTQETLDFFLKHKISLDITIDACGFGLTNVLYLEMKANNKLFAYNTAPCKSGGKHTIKTRSGHCAVCNPHSISQTLRSASEAYLYIAGSLKGKLIKIGSTSKIANRANSLNTGNYAFMNDWIVLWSAKIVKSGSIESKVQSTLLKYNYPCSYIHAGSLQESKEVFKCSYNKAKEAVNELLIYENVIPNNVNEKSSVIDFYNFNNLVK